MSLPFFNNVPVSPIITLQNTDIKLYNKDGVELLDIYVSSINIIENDTSYSAISGGIVRQLDITIGATTNFIGDFNNMSGIKYCLFQIFDNNGNKLSEKIYYIILTSVQSKFNYNTSNNVLETDCSFNIKKQYDNTKGDITVDSVIKSILRNERIGDILKNS